MLTRLSDSLKGQDLQNGNSFETLHVTIYLYWVSTMSVLEVHNMYISVRLLWHFEDFSVSALLQLGTLSISRCPQCLSSDFIVLS